MDYVQYLDQVVSYDRVLAKRAWAAIIDYFVYTLLLMLYSYFFGTFQRPDNGYLISIQFNPGFFATVLIWILYFPTMESIFGCTLAKRLFHLRVVREHRTDFPFFVAFKRHMFDWLELLPFGIIAALTARFSQHHKRLGDMIAHSRVIFERGNGARAN
jgi:uncharacterized RDD family membrane protein YckC